MIKEIVGWKDFLYQLSSFLIFKDVCEICLTRSDYSGVHLSYVRMNNVGELSVFLISHLLRFEEVVLNRKMIRNSTIVSWHGMVALVVGY